MYRSIYLVPLAFAAFVLAYVSLCLVSAPARGQDSGSNVKRLTEADLVVLISRQADDAALVGRIEKQKLAFPMDAPTLARLKKTNPSPVVLAALAKFLPTEPDAQPKAIAGKGAWERQDSGVKVYLYDVAFIDEKVGVAVGADATIVRTTDGGKTWRRAYEPKGSARRDTLNKVLFSGPKEGWAISGIVNTILHTKDAGATWNPVKLPGPGGDFGLAGAHNCAHASSGSRYYYLCWGLSGSHLYQTEDAGGTWKELTKKISVPAAGISIPDGKHGVYAARIGTPSVGYLGRTSDGGATWEVQKANDGKLNRGNFARVQMIDKDNGWYIPHFGTIHATTDGGKTWTAQELGHNPTSDLTALHFLDSKRGHVLCNHYPGEVRRTTDGGKSWTPVGMLSNTDHLSGMSFPSMQHGWVVGDRGYIEHYTESTIPPLEQLVPSTPTDEQTSVPYDSKTQGAIQVKGETGDYFFVFKDGKNMQKGNNWLLNEIVPFPPGVYEVEVNHTKRSINVVAGKTTVVVTGTLLVEGTKNKLWAPYQGKDRKLQGNNPLVNYPLALFAGSYRVDVIDPGIRTYTLTQNAEVAAGKKTVIRE